MIRHLLRTKLRGYEAIDPLLLDKGSLCPSKLNQPSFKKSILVHEGLLNLEIYHLNDLINAANMHKFNFYFLRWPLLTQDLTLWLLCKTQKGLS